MKIAIVGSRNYPNKEQVLAYVRLITQKYPEAEFVSGGAMGVDTWAADELRRLQCPVHVERAKWEEYANHSRRGKKNPAGMIRNKVMAEMVDLIVAFWDGKSPGTLGMMKIALELGKPVYLCTPQSEMMRWEGVA